MGEALVCTDFETTVCAAHYDAKVSASKVQATADSREFELRLAQESKAARDAAAEESRRREAEQLEEEMALARAAAATKETELKMRQMRRNRGHLSKCLTS